MNEETESSGLSVRLWPTIDGDLEIEFDNIGPSHTAYLSRPDVVILVNDLIRSSKITEDEINDTAK